MIRLLLVIGLVFMLVGCSSESDAQKTVEDYMEAVKIGSEFEHILSSQEFIDLFDYEYLQTLEENEKKDTVRLTYSIWEMVYGDDPDSEFPTWEDYKNNTLDYVETINEKGGNYEITQNDDSAIEYWDGESYYKEYVFLYNVEIANEAGEKIFKKAEITIKESSVENEKGDLEDGWLITDIHLR